MRAQDADKPARRAAETDHVLGKADAPNIIIDYFSLTCPHCAHFHAEVLPAIKREWIDTGQARFIYRHFPSDEVATKAAQLAECGGPENFFRPWRRCFVPGRLDDVRPTRSTSRCRPSPETGSRPRRRQPAWLTDPPFDKVLADVAVRSGPGGPRHADPVHQWQKTTATPGGVRWASTSILRQVRR